MSKMLKLTEQQLHKLIEDTTVDVLNVIGSYQYHLNDPEELLAYLWLKPNMTGINADIFVDDCGAFKMDNHPLLLFVKNGSSNNGYIPVTISDNPKIIDSSIKITLSSEIIDSIFKFIIENKKLLIAFANERVGTLDFVKAIRKLAYKL